MNTLVKWERFKKFVDDRNLPVHWEDLGEGAYYIIEAIDGSIHRSCEVDHSPTAGDPSDQKDFEDNYKDRDSSNLSAMTSINHIPKVALYSGDGDSTSYPSHDWTDKTTWYQESTRVIGEAPTNNGLIYELAHEFVIDCSNGKITFEDEICETYHVVVYDGGVEVDDADYTIEYGAGLITFDSAPGGTVTVDYSYAGDSTFTIKIPEGEDRLNIKDAEVNFVTSGFVMKPTTFSIWINHPQAGWMSVYSKKYKNIKDIINIARKGTSEIVSTDVLPGNVSIYPIHYDKRIILESNLEMELRLETEDHDPMTGSWATITIYTEIDK